MIKIVKIIGLITILTILSACNTVENAIATVTQASTPQSTATKTRSTNTQTAPVPTQTRMPSPTPEAFTICCPLEGETFDSLRYILSKPMEIPQFGQDTGHHGLDFAYFQRGDRESIQGIQIYAAFKGTTVLTLEDYYPYGFAILIETPLNTFPETWEQTLLAGYLPIPDDPGYRLYCPPVSPPEVTGEYSVYHLYAHLETKPEFEHGKPIECGELLGTVGNTGYSSNPHLHFETRLGPSGADFSTMAHYQNTNTEEQMSNYCLWRMSGFYQLFDPSELLGILP
jgi:murein DD-endopeptidase MepM/ murein hydrolase activator NlpD